jgi:hypothetical protein
LKVATRCLIYALHNGANNGITMMNTAFKALLVGSAITFAGLGFAEAQPARNPAAATVEPYNVFDAPIDQTSMKAFREPTEGTAFYNESDETGHRASGIAENPQMGGE